MTYESKGSPWEFCWDAIHEHVRLRCDNCGVDESKEEETTNE